MLYVYLRESDIHELRSFRQRLRSIRQRPKSLAQRPTGQFANVRYLVLTNKKAAYWCLEWNPDPWVKKF